MNKKFIGAALAVAPLMIFASCEKNDGPSVMNLADGDHYNVKVIINSQKTKTTSLTDEEKVNDVQVFIFRQDGSLDGYATSETNSLTVDCTVGKDRQVYAVVNAEDLSGVTTRDSLMKSVSKLSHNTLSNFEMVGNSEVFDIQPGLEPVVITVSRMAARVEVDGITNNMKAPAYRNKPITIEAVYLTNVAPTASFGFSIDPDANDYYNKMKFESSSVDSLVYEDMKSLAINYEETKSVAHYLYAYPNPSDDDISGGEWSLRCTRLVLEAKIDGNLYYYPVNLPVLEHNKTYVISDLCITKPGSSSPDEPVSTLACTFSIVVKDWEPVEISEGIVI